MATEDYEIEDLGTVELDAETDAKVNRMIAEADKEIEETRVSFRWGKEQLSLVRQAAEHMGVPYQTFIKMCVFQRALDVLKDVRAAKRTMDDHDQNSDLTGMCEKLCCLRRRWIAPPAEAAVRSKLFRKMYCIIF